MNEELLKNLSALALFMIANVTFRLAYSVKIGDFDKKALWKGIIKYAVIILGAGIFYSAGQLCPDTGVIINGETFSVPESLNVFTVAIDGVYATKCFKNLCKIFESDGMSIINESNNQAVTETKKCNEK